MSINDYTGNGPHYYRNDEMYIRGECTHFLREVLNGKIINSNITISEISPINFDTAYDPFSNNWEIDYSTTQKPGVEVRFKYEDVHRVYKQIVDNKTELDNVNWKNTQAHITISELKQLLEYNNGCRKSWDKLILLLEISGASESLISALKTLKFM